MSSDDASFFFFFFLYTRSSLWIHFPFSFIFLLPKFKEKEDVTHVCAVNREWNSMLTSLVTVFYFFFILASSYFLGIPARRHRETKKKKKINHKKRNKIKKPHWRLSVCCTIGNKEKGVGAIFVFFFFFKSFHGTSSSFFLSHSFWLIYISWFCCLPSLHNLRHRFIHMKVKGERIKTPAQIHTEKNDRKSSRTKQKQTYVCTFGFLLNGEVPLSLSLSLFFVFCPIKRKVSILSPL